MLAIAVVAGVAFAAGAIVSAGGRPAEQVRAERFAAAWSRGDYPAMYDELTERARSATSLTDFIAAYRHAASTATATAVRAGRAGRPHGGLVVVPIVVRTRIFGTLREPLRLAFEGDGDDARVAWERSLTFPGAPRGQRLERHTELPPRAAILARDGTPLAQGPERTSQLGAVASAVAGQLGPAPPEQAQRLRALGFPGDARVGVSGLERILDERVAGRPGGVLRAGAKVFARSSPRRAPDVRTTIAPHVQRAAVEALGARLGGVAVLRPRSGEILALAGIAFSGLQPPGSTFKIVTLTGVLAAGLAGPGSTYPVRTAVQLEGVELENANGESCGGSLRDAFAHSCNSVFAPLGAKLGAARLVRTAEAFGFNEDPGIPGAATSTIPSAEQIGDDLAVGSSAIGQGRVQATALQMGLVAATIAERGRRPKPTLEMGRAPQRRQVIEAGTARLVGRFMLAVVNYGTGTAAAIPGVKVAGKTGTAELRDTRKPDCVPTPDAPDCPTAPPNDPTDTDAWFAAYAPAGDPRIAVGVLLVQAGAGGDTAAPVARQLLVAGLASR